MAPVNTPGVAVNGSGGVASSGNKRVSSVPKPYVRPVIPLPYMQRRTKAVKTDIQPSSPLRINNEIAPPTPKQNNHELAQHQSQPQPQTKSPKLNASEAHTNGHKPVEETAAPPHRSHEVDTGATATETDDAPSSQESRPVTAGTQTQGTPTQSQTTGQSTPPGMSSSFDAHVANDQTSDCVSRHSPQRSSFFFSSLPSSYTVASSIQ